MKSAKQFVKFYEAAGEEYFQNCGNYYPPRTWDEFFALNAEIFEKYLKNEGLLDEMTDFIFVK